MPALTHSPANVLRALLIAAGQAGDPTAVDAQGVPTEAWPLYTDGEPSSPDEVITLYDTDGMAAGREMVGGSILQHYGQQLRVRTTTRARCWEKTDGLRNYLAEHVTRALVTLGASQYLVWDACGIGQAVFVGAEKPASWRVIFTVNFFLQLEQVA